MISIYNTPILHTTPTIIDELEHSLYCTMCIPYNVNYYKRMLIYTILEHSLYIFIL